jgi:pantoate kinase
MIDAHVFPVSGIMAGSTFSGIVAGGGAVTRLTVGGPGVIEISPFPTPCGVTLGALSRIMILGGIAVVAGKAVGQSLVVK